MSPAVGLFEFLEEEAPEQAGEDLDGGEEGGASGSPLTGYDIEPGVGDDDMKMGMEEHLLVPCVEDGGAACMQAATAGVGGDRLQGRRGGPEEDVEGDLAVGERDLCDLPGQREHDVEVGHREDVLTAGLHPFQCGQPLAGRAVAVVARVVERMIVPATVTAPHVSAQHRGPADLDGGHGLELRRTQVPATSLPDGHDQRLSRDDFEIGWLRSLNMALVARA